MADLVFSQPERRSFLVPGLIALGVLAVVFGLVIAFTPHHIADITITHTAIVPTHTVFQSGTMIVGRSDETHDEFYVLANVRVQDDLKLPLFIKDLTGTFTPGDGSEAITTSAVEKNEFANLYVTFPALKPLASAPLLRETAIQPGEHTEGMILVHFPVTKEMWDKRKAAVVTIDFYHQGPLSVTIPNP